MVPQPCLDSSKGHWHKNTVLITPYQERSFETSLLRVPMPQGLCKRTFPSQKFAGLAPYPDQPTLSREALFALASLRSATLSKPPDLICRTTPKSFITDLFISFFPLKLKLHKRLFSLVQLYF